MFKFSQRIKQPLVGKLIYEGKLTKRVKYLKCVSVTTSVAMSGAYAYVVQKNGLSLGMTIMGLGFTPFFISPLLISWLFKRYVTTLTYDASDDKYTAYHFGLFTNTKATKFDASQVKASEVNSILNTFEVNGKPFFLNEEDLIDAESVKLYKKMLGLNKLTN